MISLFLALAAIVPLGCVPWSSSANDLFPSYAWLSSWSISNPSLVASSSLNTTLAYFRFRSFIMCLLELSHDAVSFMFSDPELSIPESLGTIYNVYAQNVFGYNVTDLFLEPYDVSITLPYPEAYDFDVEDLVVVQYNEEMTVWEQLDSVPQLNINDKLISVSIFV